MGVVALRLGPLQWGRDHVIAELIRVCRRAALGDQLQWGRDHVIAEFNLAKSILDAAWAASMGPRSRDRGIPEAAASRPCGVRFNGAAIT